MTKKNIAILGLVTVVVVVGIIAFWPNKKEKEEVVEERVMIPSQVVTDFGSETGAMDIKLDKEQYNEVYLIKDLRNSAPIDKTYFVIDFDYNINKFVVKLKDVRRGGAEFEKWLNDTGYNVISKEYFQIQ
ncbi:MAG: hypothetical protein WC503_05255 [Candidatus Shapirobacteria bacterium]